MSSASLGNLRDCSSIAQAGLAATPDLSFLAACLARPVLQIDDAQKFLAPLPLETLASFAVSVASCMALED